MAKTFTDEEKLALTRLYKKRIDAFERHYKTLHEDMREYYKIYKGAQGVSAEYKDSYYDFKLIYSIIRGLVPSLVLSDPDIILKPKKEDLIGKVKTVEAVVNYYWNELQLKKEMKKIVLDTLVRGFGVVKLGWRFKTKMRPAPKQDDYDESEDIGLQEDLEPNEMIKEGEPFVRRINPLNFRWDPQATSLEECRWTGEAITRPLESVKRSGMYDQKVVDGLQPTIFGEQDTLDGDSGEMVVIDQDPDKYVKLYEIHDKERNLLITFSPSCEMPLRVIEYPYTALEGSHYEILRFHELTESLEGLSLVGLLKDQQTSLNRIRSYQVDHVRRVVPKLIVSKQSAMSDEDIQKLTSAKANTVSLVDGDATDVKLLQAQPIPSDTYSVADIVRSDMLQTSGTPPSRFGLAQGGRTSATEIRSMDSSEQFRLEDARAEVEDFASNVCRKMIQVICDNIDDKKTFKIVGAQNYVPLDYKKDDLIGEFDYTIGAGSMARPDRSVERQQLITLYQLAQSDPQVNKTEIFRAILDTFPTVKNKDIIAPPTEEQPPAPPAQPPLPLGLPGGPVPSSPVSPVGLDANLAGSVGN